MEERESHIHERERRVVERERRVVERERQGMYKRERAMCQKTITEMRTSKSSELQVASCELHIGATNRRQSLRQSLRPHTLVAQGLRRQ